MMSQIDIEREVLYNIYFDLDEFKTQLREYHKEKLDDPGYLDYLRSEIYKIESKKETVWYILTN